MAIAIALENIKNSTLFPIVARFPEAEKRLLDKKICMKCGARNAPKATRCRRCRSKSLRPKAKEGRGV